MKKIIIIIGVALLLIITIGIGVYIKLKVEAEDDKRFTEKILETSKGTDKLIAKIKDNKMGNEIKLTNFQFEYAKDISSDSKKITKKEFIEDAIFAEEAKQRGMKLTEEETKEIEEGVYSDDILKGIDNEDDKNIIVNALRDYKTRITYVYKLKDHIIEEICSGNLILQDEELKEAVIQYRSVQERIKEAEKYDDEPNEIRNLSEFFYKSEDMYYDKIMKKYNIKKY